MSSNAYRTPNDHFHFNSNLKVYFHFKLTTSNSRVLFNNCQAQNIYLSPYQS